MKKGYRGFIVYAVFVLIVIGIWYFLSETSFTADTYTYHQYQSDLEAGDVSSVIIEQNAETPTGTLLVTLADDPTDQREINVSDVNAEQEYLKEKGFYNYLVKNIPHESWLSTWLPYLIIFGAMFILFIIMMNINQSAGGGGSPKMMNFGKSRARMTTDENKKVNFSKVAGLKEEKEELVEIVDFLRAPAKYTKLGARIPKGVLLVGPPGTGKTLLAKAVAGEAGVPFFSISGSDFVEMFVGVGASRVRDLFDQAKKNAPSIIFIDEIDAVGRHRGAGLGGGHDEREQTLNQLLVEMDGFAANSGVIVIAATNRRDILDPALLRPGRFDRQIVVSYPDIKGREAILKVHTRNKPLGPDVELSTIAKTTAGFTGADLENLVNEAALLAVKKGRLAITMEDIEEATIKVVAGPEKKSRLVPNKDKRLTAFHEAGHAVCTFYCETQDPVHQVSIIPRGAAGGFTMSLPTEDRNYRRKTEMEEDLVVLLGGRVAEQLVLDDISTGASNDIQRATDLAKAMVTRYGFSEKLGPIVYGTDQNEVFLGRDINQTRCSEEIAGLIDSEVRRLIDTAYNKTRMILKDHADQLHTVANYLYDHEKIDADEFLDLMFGLIPAGTNAELDEPEVHLPQEEIEKRFQRAVKAAEELKKKEEENKTETEENPEQKED